MLNIIFVCQMQDWGVEQDAAYLSHCPLALADSWPMQASPTLEFHLNFMTHFHSLLSCQSIMPCLSKTITINMLVVKGLPRAGRIYCISS